MTRTRDPNRYEPCFFCEKPVRIDRPYWVVHITLDEVIVPKDYDGEDSHGGFAIGPECRKRSPLAFRVQGLPIQKES